MKKLILPLIILSLLFGSISFAQETELPPPGLTPDSPFYFLDTLGEKIGMFFTFGAEKKAAKAFKYAEEKLAEVKAMAEANKIKPLEKANQKYQEFLDIANTKTTEAKEKGKDVEELATLITGKTLKHQEILIEVLGKVPEQAKKGIENAIEASKNGSETAIQMVTGAKKEELQKKAVEIRIKNWNVYQNKEYGFEVKYPKEWQVISQKYNPSSGLYYQLFLTNNEQLTLALLDAPNREAPRDELIYTLAIWEQGNIAEHYQEDVHYKLRGTINNYDFVSVDDYRNPGKEIFDHIFSTFKFIEKLEEAKERTPKIEEVPKVKEKVDEKVNCEKETEQKDKDYCYLNLAISIRDASLCEKIADVDPEHNCYIKVAIASNNISICEKEEYQVFKNFCYQKIAIFNRDALICHKIPNPTYCYSRVASITGNVFLCQQLSNQKNRDDCYYKTALLMENLSPCEKITDKASKDTCYRKVGMARGDISFCEEEEDQLVKDTCYYKIAIKTYNAFLCEKITYKTTKNSCYRYMEIEDPESFWTIEKQREQRDSQRVSDLFLIRTAIEFYYEDNLSYPVLADISEDGEFLKILADEGFIRKIVPLDPQHPEHYYEYSGTRESFTLKSYIEEEGGINDMKDGLKDHAYTITYTNP